MTFGQGFECRFEPVDSDFRWDALLLFMGFCVFEIEILVIVLLIMFSMVIIIIGIILVTLTEISFLGFQY